MNRMNWFDIILFRLGLIRVKRGVTMFIHEQGIMVSEGYNATPLEALIMFLAGFIVQMTDSDLDSRIKLARAEMLANEVLEFMKNDIQDS